MERERKLGALYFQHKNLCLMFWLNEVPCHGQTAFLYQLTLSNF